MPWTIHHKTDGYTPVTPIDTLWIKLDEFIQDGVSETSVLDAINKGIIDENPLLQDKLKQWAYDTITSKDLSFALDAWYTKVNCTFRLVPKALVFILDRVHNNHTRIVYNGPAQIEATLHGFAIYGLKSQVQELVSANTFTHRQLLTVIKSAAAFDHVHIVEYLVGEADFDVEDIIDILVSSRSLDVISHIVQTYCHDFHRDTWDRLFFKSLNAYNSDVIAYLHNYNFIDINAKDIGGRTKLMNSTCNAVHIMLHGNSNNIYENAYKKILSLLQAGADPNIRDDADDVPLMIAVNESLINTTIVDELVKYGADTTELLYLPVTDRTKGIIESIANKRKRSNEESE